MGYDRTSCSGRNVGTLTELYSAGLLGDWCFEGDVVYIRMPDGDGENASSERGSITPWPLDPNHTMKFVDPGNYWEWDGNLDAPTLFPSLHWVGVWHGHMRQGKLISE